MFALSLVDILSLLLSLSTYFNIFFIFVKSIIWITHTKSLKNSCWFEIWMGFVGPILIKLWTSSIWGFLELPLWRSPGNCLCKHAGDHSVTTEACSHLTSLVWVCVLWLPWKLNGAICAMVVIFFIECRHSKWSETAQILWYFKYYNISYYIYIYIYTRRIHVYPMP